MCAKPKAQHYGVNLSRLLLRENGAVADINLGLGAHSNQSKLHCKKIIGYCYFSYIPLYGNSQIHQNHILYELGHSNYTCVTPDSRHK